MSKHVVCAISGGVDSAVATYFLKNAGYKITGCFMRNWNRQDELATSCKVDSDYEDAKYVCDKLNVPLVDVDFSKSYWNQVFTRFLSDYENGFTPNPDILCNKFIKFPLLVNYSLKHIDNVDFIATGHYARLRYDKEKSIFRLLKGADELKDQSFFLSQIEPNLLKYVLFPIGDFTKSEIRKIAKDIGLQRVFDKRSSVGICFIGKRNFSDFIDEYIQKKVGNIIDLESSKILDEHDGIHHYTIGQRVLVNRKIPYFIARKDIKTQSIYVVKGTNHPALYNNEMIVERPHWIGENLEQESNDDVILDSRYEFKFQTRHHQTPIESLKKVKDQVSNQVRYILRSRNFFRGIAPGQFAVFYNKEECLGSAKIIETTNSLYDLNYKGEIENSDKIFLKNYLTLKESLNKYQKSDLKN